MDKDMVLQDGLIEGAEIAYQRIIHHLNEINEKSTLTDNVLIMMTKNLLERIRTIQLLSKIEREESITILTRSFLELQVSLKFILNSNTDQRALSYYYNYKIQTVKNLISMTKSDSSYSLSLNEKDLERLRKEVPNANSVEDYLLHFERKWNKLFSPMQSKARKGTPKQYRKWYSLNWEYNSFKDLMVAVGFEESLYHFFYGITSIDVHGKGALGNMKIDESYWTLTGSMPSHLCYAIIDSALSSALYDLSSYYDLVEDEEINRALTLMANSSILI